MVTAPGVMTETLAVNHVGWGPPWITMGSNRGNAQAGRPGILLASPFLFLDFAGYIWNHMDT